MSRVIAVLHLDTVTFLKIFVFCILLYTMSCFFSHVCDILTIFIHISCLCFFSTLTQKKEDKKIRKLRAKITYHEARGGNRPGKVGDKRGQWSENLEYDIVCMLKAEIEAMQDNAVQRAWGNENAVKDMGTRRIPTMSDVMKKKEAEKAKAAAVAAESPASVMGIPGEDAVPQLAI